MTPSALTPEQADAFGRCVDALVANIELVVKGKTAEVRLAVLCLLAEGHVLIEDLPGTGKTTLARALAQSVSGQWKRIQCTPDMLPSDITGAHVFDQRTGDFAFRPGPVFANLVLADELNRASPKAQSALLEAMEERQHTAQGQRFDLPRPFTVIATQNHIEQGGTFGLPQAQLDRFMMRLRLGELDRGAELSVLADVGSNATTGRALAPVMSTTDVGSLIGIGATVYASPEVQGYIVDLASATRRSPALGLSVSTRGAVAMLRAVRVYAASQGRNYVVPDDVLALVHPVFDHRLTLSAESQIDNVSVAEVVAKIVAAVPAPNARTGG